MNEVQRYLINISAVSMGTAGIDTIVVVNDRKGHKLTKKYLFIIYVHSYIIGKRNKLPRTIFLGGVEYRSMSNMRRGC